MPHHPQRASEGGPTAPSDFSMIPGPPCVVRFQGDFERAPDRGQRPAFNFLELPARYAVVDVRGLRAAHSMSGQRDPSVPNRRQHEARGQNGTKVQMMLDGQIGGLAPGPLLDRSDFVAVGPPLVLADGRVIAGNNRVQLLQRAANRFEAQASKRSGPRESREQGILASTWVSYRSALQVRCREWGIPISAGVPWALVRVLDERAALRHAVAYVPDYSPFQVWLWLNDLSDRPLSKPRDAGALALAAAERLLASPSHCAGFRAAFRGLAQASFWGLSLVEWIEPWRSVNAVQRLLTTLVAVGAISPYDRAGMTRRSQYATPEGRAFVQRVLLAVVTRHAELALEIPDDHLTQIWVLADAFLEPEPDPRRVEREFLRRAVSSALATFAPHVEIRHVPQRLGIFEGVAVAAACPVCFATHDDTAACTQLHRMLVTAIQSGAVVPVGQAILRALGDATPGWDDPDQLRRERVSDFAALSEQVVKWVGSVVPRLPEPPPREVLQRQARALSLSDADLLIPQTLWRTAGETIEHVIRRSGATRSGARARSPTHRRAVDWRVTLAALRHMALTQRPRTVRDVERAWGQYRSGPLANRLPSTWTLRRHICRWRASDGWGTIAAVVGGQLVVQQDT